MAHETMCITFTRRRSLAGYFWWHLGLLVAIGGALVRSSRIIDAGAGLLLRGMTIAAAMLLVCLAGCGASWSSNARHSIEVAAVATDVGDGILAQRVRTECGPLVEHLEAGSEERVAAADDCLHEHHFDAAAHAVDVADHALRAAQAAVDAAERAGSTAIWDAAAPHLTVAVCELELALHAAGVRWPLEVEITLTALQAVAGTCRPPTTDSP